MRYTGIQRKKKVEQPHKNLEILLKVESEIQKLKLEMEKKYSEG